MIRPTPRPQPASRAAAVSAPAGRATALAAAFALLAALALALSLAGCQPASPGDASSAAESAAVEEAAPVADASEGAAASAASNNVAAFSEAGKLHVEGTGLADEKGSPVQLRGVSTHGLAWFPQYVNADAFATLREDWGANVVRLAMYTAESGGYCTDGDRAALLALIDEGVRAATAADLYVIIDWHILSDGNPTAHQAEALEFFDTVAARYAECDNVIYEVCNEPQNSPFATVIKPYAEAALGAIRAHDPDAVVLVGTNTWSQDIDEVIGNRIDDDNVMYTLHFYAATHKDNIREKLTRALDAGVPAFVSECSITDASGNGHIDGDSAAAWLNLLNSRNVSFVAWSLSNKNETSALIAPDVQATSGWAEADLTDAGRWFKEAIASS
ncbi:glycoside hydrolase family 5 protein [Adlercreutzia sp. ZJ242]|uniref:glycoside hydrolase family 5 protein n=1 Tax=Adlercreutzia sp. ZJ242 TaxID=2709409 RepID=UPI00197DB893|nr:glycoside hydrolase family 5 protein [Adlercreutzia sp. ZJ242]